MKFVKLVTALLCLAVLCSFFVLPLWEAEVTAALTPALAGKLLQNTEEETVRTVLQRLTARGITLSASFRYDALRFLAALPETDVSAARLLLADTLDMALAGVEEELDPLWETALSAAGSQAISGALTEKSEALGVTEEELQELGITEKELEQRVEALLEELEEPMPVSDAAARVRREIDEVLDRLPETEEREALRQALYAEADRLLAALTEGADTLDLREALLKYALEQGDSSSYGTIASTGSDGLAAYLRARLVGSLGEEELGAVLLGMKILGACIVLTLLVWLGVFLRAVLTLGKDWLRPWLWPCLLFGWGLCALLELAPSLLLFALREQETLGAYVRALSLGFALSCTRLSLLCAAAALPLSIASHLLARRDP